MPGGYLFYLSIHHFVGQRHFRRLVEQSILAEWTVLCVANFLISQTSWSGNASPKNYPKLRVDLCELPQLRRKCSDCLGIFMGALVKCISFRHCKPTWLQTAFQFISYFFKRQICWNLRTEESFQEKIRLRIYPSA